MGTAVTHVSTLALVADTHFLTSAGIAEILHHHLGIETVKCAADFRTACALLAADPAYTMITVDLSLTGMNGLHGIRQLRSAYPALHIVIVSDQTNQAAMLSALAAGIHGYILKDMDAAAMIGAFKLVLEGKIFVPNCVSDTPAWTNTPQPTEDEATEISLTARQRDVVQHLRKGFSNKEIARALDISESTVKVHMAAAFRQLGVHNRVGVIAVLDGKMSRATRARTPEWADRRRIAVRA